MTDDKTTWRDDEGRLAFSMSGRTTPDQVELVNQVCEAIGMPPGYFDALVGVWRGDDKNCHAIPVLRAIVAAHKLGAAIQAQDLAEAQQLGREIAARIAKCVEKGDRMDAVPLFVFEHDDGRRITCRADDARLVGEPAWHRVGPVEVDTLAFLSGPCRLAVRRFAPQRGQTEAEFIQSAVVTHLRQEPSATTDAERDAVLVKRSTLMSWKDEVNTIAALSLKAERHEHGAELKQAIADVLAMPPASGPTDAERLREALNDAATSLETISRLAGRSHYVFGDERVETYMGHFDEVRAYASARAGQARAAMRATPADGGEG